MNFPRRSKIKNLAEKTSIKTFCSLVSLKRNSHRVADVRILGVWNALDIIDRRNTPVFQLLTHPFTGPSIAAAFIGLRKMGNGSESLSYKSAVFTISAISSSVNQG